MVTRRFIFFGTIVVTWVLCGAAPIFARSTFLPLWQTAQQAEGSADPRVFTEQDVAYGKVGGHPLLLDIYEPRELASTTNDLRPAIVLIHGGAWSSFDKGTMKGMGLFLARSGFVAFSVDYRLFQEKENLWPAQLDDVQRAVRWIRANAAKYHVDPKHMGAFGHSAGAQLAALLGMEDTRDNSDPELAKYSSKVQAVVDVSGPTDFTTAYGSDGGAFFTAFFGGDYAHSSQVWRDASPALRVSKTTSPFLIVHGTQDSDVPIRQAQELADKLKHSHIPVKFVKVEDGHTFETVEARKQLALETRDFFFQYLKSGQ
jgi:acetyl esterase/lipase